MPFSEWNKLQEEDAERTATSSTPLPFQPHPCDLASWGLGESLNTYSECSEASFTISPELTTILHTTCADVFRAEPVDIYIAALHLAFAQTFNDRPLPTIWNQEHGRDPWDAGMHVAETVGWLAALCPVSLRATPAGEADLLHMIRDVKDTRRAIPHRGCQYFASRFFGPLAETRCAEGWPFEIMFTYLEPGNNSISASPSGDSALEIVKLPGQEIHSRSGNVGSQVTRLALFEIEISVERGAATVKIVFNRASEQQKEIENWILAYEHLLYEAVGRMRYRAQELTMADIPLLRTDHQGLEKLNSKHMRALGLPSAQNIEDVLPASRTQEEVLCCSHFPSGRDNHIICALTFKGGNEVDHTHICSVWEQIVARHPALRTVFVDSVREDGLFDQVVLKRCSSDMLFFEPAPEADPVESLRALPTMPTIPGQPRHRLSICTSSIGAFMKIEVSQAICDMTSLQLLVSELRRNYNSAKIPMNVLSSSHKSCLQHVLSKGRPDSTQYWQACLRDVEPCHFPGTQMTKAIRNLHNHIDVDVSSSSVDDFCRKFSVNRGTLIRVAWGLVLRVFTNTNKICFGFRTSGRESANAPRDMQHSIGCYENIVPVHMDLSATGSLEAAVHDAAERFVHCLPHQQISFAEIEHAIGLRGEKLFNTCVSFIESPTDLKSRFCSNRPQVETSCLGLSGNTENGTIALTVMFINGYLACDIAHPGLSQKQVSSIVYAFGEAINSIIANPFASLDSLNLSAQDNVALHGSGRPDLPEPCLHSLFINQARRTPEAAAVTAADGDLSYQSLARLLQRLAALLSERGVRPGVPVVAILGRTMWSVVSILAILKAGGCFVPVDGEDRHMVEAVIKEVRPRLTLVTENVSPDLNLPFDGVVLVNDSLFAGRLGLDAPTRRASGDDVACILFPAGSSRSKELRGFMYSHVALSSAFLAQGEPLGLNGESRVLQISSFSVDTSLVETLATLVHGGCVCIPSPAERKSNMAGAVRRMQANWTYMTPIVARRLRPSAMPSLKIICFRTRGLDEDTCAPWMRRVRVLLAYGCLEACPLGISVLEVTRREHLGRIAQPFLGRCWVASADDPSRLLPEGAIGELCIESPTIAHRYVTGAPVKPLVQFDDHTSQAGQKMIRFIKTSQSVRWVEDGTLELVLNPRRDLAINGRPVSAVEVEMQLRRCLDSDLDVAVETVISQDGKQLLVAFIQLDKTWQGPEDPARLEPCMKERAYFARHFAQTSLGETLPKHSIPSAFIPVRRLPVTSAMKVNRRKLQRWVRHISEQDILAISQGGAARLSGMLKPLPLTNIEERMRSIWSDLLQVHESAIEPGAGFMTLGGGKFLARALVIRCREEGLEISIGDVLRGASLTQLCQGITLESDARIAKEPEPGNQTSIASACAIADEGVIKASVASQLGINRGDILDISEASASQIRATELGLLRGKGGFSHLVLSFSNLASATQLEAACFGLCVIHPILRTALVRSGRQVYQVAARSWSPEFQRVSCPAFRLGALVDKTIKKDASDAAPIAALLTKFTYFDAGKHSMLVLRMTRAQYDEVSIPLLVKDLAQLYAGQRAPAGRSTYFDHVRSVQLACDGTGMEYWQRLMQGADMTRVIDWTGPPFIPVAVQKLQRQITTVDLSSLGATFDTVLKAAWALVLATLSGRRDVLFGEVVEGRHLRLTKGNSPMGVAGPMQNTIPIRVSFGERQGTPLDLLQIIQDQKTPSQAYENAAWDDIVKSTAMPWWTRFSTAVHHRSHSGDTQEVRFNDAACHFSIREPESQLDHDILVTTSALDSCRVDISLSYCDTHIPQAVANEAFDLLCAAIDLLTSASMTHPVLPSASDLQSIQSRLPLPEPHQTATTSQESKLPTPQHLALQSLVTKAWARAVNLQELGVPESHLHNTAFYDIWGGLIPAAEIADRITRGLPRLRIPGANEVKISTEEVVRHPTMAAQIDLLTRKILNPETPKRRLTGSFIPGSSAYLGRSIRRLATHARSHSRSASEGSSRSSPIATSPPRTIFDEHAACPRVSNAGSSNPSPTHDIITEKNEEQVEANTPPPEATNDGKRPALKLLVHGNNSGGSGSQGSMESLTTGTTGSEDEVGDVLGPLEWTPAVGRYSPAAGEELGMVSPLSPVDKTSMAVGSGGDAAGLGVQGLGPTSPVASIRRKRASSVFSRMGFSSPV
jgi:non-ribosomal peptide synthetase component F